MFEYIFLHILSFIAWLTFHWNFSIIKHRSVADTAKMQTYIIMTRMVVSIENFDAFKSVVMILQFIQYVKMLYDRKSVSNCQWIQYESRFNNPIKFQIIIACWYESTIEMRWHLQENKITFMHTCVERDQFFA